MTGFPWQFPQEKPHRRGRRMVRLGRSGLDRRGVTAVEFALEAPVFFVMIFGLLNLGWLGYVEYVLNHGVELSARYASIAASGAFVVKRAGGGFSCPSATVIQGRFADAVSPPIGAAAVPAVAVNWGGALDDVCTPGTNSSSIPGAWVTVSAQYDWSPLLLGFLFTRGFVLSAQSTSPIIFGSS